MEKDNDVHEVLSTTQVILNRVDTPAPVKMLVCVSLLESYLRYSICLSNLKASKNVSCFLHEQHYPIQTILEWKGEYQPQQHEPKHLSLFAILTQHPIDLSD